MTHAGALVGEGIGKGMAMGITGLRMGLVGITKGTAAIVKGGVKGVKMVSSAVTDNALTDGLKKVGGAAGNLIMDNKFMQDAKSAVMDNKIMKSAKAAVEATVNAGDMVITRSATMTTGFVSAMAEGTIHALEATENLLTKAENTDVLQISTYISRIRQAGLRYVVYRGQDRARLFLLVGASEARLRVQAQITAYDLQLNAVEVRRQAHSNRLKIATRVQRDDEGHDIWNDLYGPYKAHDDSMEERFLLYQIYDDEGTNHPNTILRSKDRMALTDRILMDLQIKGGAGLNIETDILNEKGALLAYYALHNNEKRSVLANRLLQKGMLLHPPLEDVRAYYGA